MHWFDWLVFKRPTQRNVTTRIAESKMQSARFDAFDAIHCKRFAYFRFYLCIERMIALNVRIKRRRSPIHVADLTYSIWYASRQIEGANTWNDSLSFCLVFFHSGSAPWWRRRSSCVRLLLFEKREQKWMKVFYWKRKKIPAKNGFSATMRNGMRKMVGIVVFFMRFLKPLMKIFTWIPWISLTFYENFAFDFFLKKISFF